MRFGGDDVVRHKLVQRIVEAYDAHDAEQPSGLRPAGDHRRRTRLTLLEIDVIGSALPPGRVEEAVAYAAASAGIEDGHVAIEFVDSERIAELNETWREKDGPTDVLSFPVDEDDEDLPAPGRAARAGRRLHLPRAHRGSGRGGRPRRPAPDRDGPRDRRRRDARRPGRDHGMAAMTGTRSGFVALAGRPNVGKSTLVNAMVGHKVAIVSDKPQTTRRAIRGVVTAPDRYQLVLTDLPGVQRPRDALTARMQKRVETELGRGRRGAVRRQRRPGRRRSPAIASSPRRSPRPRSRS